MKTLICLNRTWKLALSATLLTLLPMLITAQASDKKDAFPAERVQQPGQVKDSTISVTTVVPVISDREATVSKESVKKDSSVNDKKDSFTPSQDEWLKKAGYFKSSKVQAAKKIRREPEPRPEWP